ncbi:MAG: STAS domain-containing protein [Verrucomicrobiae bacterium]
MNFVADHESLHATGLDRLSASNSAEFKQQVLLRMSATCRLVELDCSTVRFIDSDGLGTLVGIHKRLAVNDGKVRLHQPSPTVRQLLRLLHLDEIFEVTP